VRGVLMAEIMRFIRDNRREIDGIIFRACPNVGRLNDRQRYLWVLNWEPLYRWARSAGVRFE
jgi:hypothetical protein